MLAAEITRAAIRPEAVLARAASEAAGAVVLFLGTVRREHEGRAVTGLHYDAYEPMARQELAAIVAVAAERWALEHVVAVHRVGTLTVGEVSVAIAVAAAHRGAAYDAARFVIEEIKVRLPVWKQEHYAAGEARWLEAPVADGAAE